MSTMNMKFTNRLFLAFAALAMMATYAACKKSDAKPQPPTITTPTNNGIDTTSVGDSIILAPTVSAPGTFTYAWSVDGTPVPGDSTFHFTPTQRGDFQVTVTVANTGGSNTFTYKIHVYGAYENGFFVINEGNYGSGSGTVSFYRYNTGQLEDSVYTKVNPSKDLGPATSTAEFGAIWDGKFYILTKAGGPIVQTDAYSLSETGRVASAATNDWRAFLGIDSTHALVSSGNGIYPLNLSTMTLGTLLSSVTGDVDDMIAAGNYIFINSENNGVQALNKTTYAVVATWSNLNVGFAVTPDGAVWTEGGTDLVRIDPSTLDTTMTPLPFTVYSTAGYWHAGSITASATENSVFISANGQYGQASTIYKYVSGNASSVQTPFITLASNFMTYGNGIGFDPIKQNLVLLTVDGSYANNGLNIYNPSSASVLSTSSFSGYYFPTIAVFH
jgi:hypothetical protein